jgi:Protein of unknown function (DUF579)./Nucleotide-diphospho-sugar transferase.
MTTDLQVSPQNCLDREMPSGLPRKGNDLGLGAGFVILSTGEHRRQLLWNCLASLRRNYPDAPVHVVSDTPVDVPFTLVRPYRSFRSRQYKTQLLKYSPFETTVVIDDDALVNFPFGTADDWLGECDFAMVQDHRIPTLGTLKSIPVTRLHVKGLKQFLGPHNAHKPYFNSGVMIFRNSPRMREFFEQWHADWLTHQCMDQTALVTALEKTNLPVTPLPGALNFLPHRHGRGMAFADMPGYILHFIKEKHRNAERYLQEIGLPKGEPHRRAQLFSSVQRGRSVEWSPEQLRRMSSLIQAMAPCRLLVFGCGKEAALWAALNAEGTTVFVEDRPLTRIKLPREGARLIMTTYPSRRGEWLTEPVEPPVGVRGEWDIVLVDGPRGDRWQTPGRELPVRWAAQMAPRLLAVHDWNRPWERAVCDRYLGAPDHVAQAAADQPELALWARSPPERDLIFEY